MKTQTSKTPVYLATLLCLLQTMALAQSLSITSFSPTYGCAGTLVTITGKGFTGATFVKFGGVDAASFTVTSDTSITTVTGGGKTGLITVTTPSLAATSSNQFLFRANNKEVAYIGDGASNSVRLINTASNTEIGSIRVGNDPGSVATSPDGSRVYVANRQDNTVSVISTLENNVIATVPVGILPNNLVASPDGSKLYVLNTYMGTISVMMTNTNKVVATIPAGFTPVGMDISPDGSKLYVANNDYAITVISAITYKAISSFPIHFFPVAVAASPDGRKVYIAASRSVLVLNVATNKITDTIPFNSNSSNIALSPDGTRLYCLTNGDNKLNIINTSTKKIIAAIPVGIFSYGLSVNFDGSKVYVLNYSSKSITVIDAATNSVMATIPHSVAAYEFGKFISGIVPCAPTISDLSADSACPGVPIIIKGTNFRFVYSVKFGDNAAASFNVESDSVITAVPGKFTGTVNISVGTAGGTAVGGDLFRLSTTCPVITSFTPEAGCNASCIVISGVNFSGVTAVKIGGINVASFILNSATSITAIPGAAKTGHITVSTLAGIGKSTNTFRFGKNDSAFAYIANSGDNTVSIINTTTGVVTGSIPLEAAPVAIALTPGGKKVYTANNEINVINTSTGTVENTIKLSGVSSAAVNPAGDKLYLVNHDSSFVYVIATASNALLAKIPVDLNPFGIALSPDGSKVYVTSIAMSSVDIIDAATNKVVSTAEAGKSTTILAGTSPEGIAVTPDGTKIYVANTGNNTIGVINALTNELIYVIPADTKPFGVAITPDGSKVYVTNQVSNSVSVISTVSNAVIATVPVGRTPMGISVSPDGSTAYVANSGSDNVSLINTATDSVSATVQVGSKPVSFGNFITQFLSCQPTIDSVYPGSVCPNNPVTIKGANLRSAYAIKFGDSAAISFTINSDTSITAFPGSIGGPVNISVTTAGGKALSIDSVTMPEACPVINSFSPAANCDGQLVTINGVNLTGATAVKFGGADAAFFSVSSDTSIIATAGIGKSGAITVITPLGSVSSNTPFSFRSNNSSFAYIANWGNETGSTVSVINTTTNVVVSTIPVSRSPNAIAVTPDGSHVYVAGDQVSVINTNNGTVENTLLLNYISGIAVSPVGDKVYLSDNRRSLVYVIATATNTLLAVIPVSAYPTGIAVSPDGSKVYVACTQSGIVKVIDGATNTVTASIPARNAYGIVMSPDGRKIYVSNGSNVKVISTITNKPIKTEQYGGNPGIAITPDGSKLYVTDNNNFVNVIELTSDTYHSVKVGKMPRGISVDPDGSKVYVTNSGSNTVSVISTASDTVIATIPVGVGPISFGNFVASYQSCPPIITSFSPASVCPGNAVTIKGTNFRRIQSVNFGSNPVASFVVNSDTSITAIAGKNSDTANISVRATWGTTVSNTNIAILKCPTIISFSPESSCNQQVVNINGTNFTGTTAVKFGGVDAASFTVTSDTTITAVPGNGQTGIINVVNMQGTANSSGIFVFGGTTNTFAYIMNPGGPLNVVNTVTKQIIAKIGIGVDPYGIAVSADGSRVYVSDNGHVAGTALSVINTASNTVIAKVQVGIAPFGVTLSPDGSKVYVANWESNTVSVVNTAKNAVTATIKTSRYPFGIGVSPDGTKLYVSTDLKNLDIIDITSNTIIATVPVGNEPFGVAVSPDGSTVYVSNRGDSTISVISAVAHTLIATIIVGRQPNEIALSPDGSKLYVAVSNFIKVINTADNSFSDSISVIGTPAGVSVSRDGSHVYVTNQGSEELSIISTASNTVTSTIHVGSTFGNFGYFLADFSPCVLPLSLINFTGSLLHGNAVLNWHTVTEINTAFFNVQRSIDGLNFSTVGKLTAAGNSTLLQNYTYTDMLAGLSPMPKLLYYRLQMADNDGANTYSKTVTLVPAGAPLALQVFPNPTHDVLSVWLKGATGPLVMTVINSEGKALQSSRLNAPTGGQLININTSSLAFGMYLLHVIYHGKSYVQKFIKQ